MTNIGQQRHDGHLNWSRMFRAIVGHVCDIERLDGHCHIDCDADKHVNEAINVKRLKLEPVKPFFTRVY